MSAIKTVLIDTIGDLELHEQDDGAGDALFVVRHGTKKVVASAWGPAADGTGEWFASRWLTEVAAVRVENRDAAIAYITAPTAEEATA